MLFKRLIRLEIKHLTKNYKMAFDSSIENLIIEENSKNKINNILHIGACLGEEISFYQTLNPEKIYWFEPNPKRTDLIFDRTRVRNPKHLSCFCSLDY